MHSPGGADANRAFMQRSCATNAAPCRGLGINVTTAARWRKPNGVTDMRMGPKEAHSTALSDEEEAVIVAVRPHTLLPPDECLCARQPKVPQPTRPSLHRCHQRHGISRLPDMRGGKPAGKTSGAIPSGMPISTSPGCAQAKETAPVRGHRPHVLVRLCRLARAGGQCMCESFFATLECAPRTAGSSGPGPKPVVPALSSSKPGTTPRAGIPLWAASPPSPTKGPLPKGWNPQARNRPRNRGNCNSNSPPSSPSDQHMPH